VYKCAKKCKRCRKPFIIWNNNQKYCDDCKVEANRERCARKRKDPRYRAHQRRYWKTPAYKARWRKRYYERRKDKRWVAKERKRSRKWLREKRRSDPKYRAQQDKSNAERQRKIRLKYKRVLWILQNGECAVCLRPLSKKFKLTHLDHDHGCREHAKQYPCSKCIRGLTHPTCNCTFLSIAERAPHLQSRHIKKYLSQRPLAKMTLL